jgi:hypothetical protein
MKAMRLAAAVRNAFGDFRRTFQRQPNRHMSADFISKKRGELSQFTGDELQPEALPKEK